LSTAFMEINPASEAGYRSAVNCSFVPIPVTGESQDRPFATTNREAEAVTQISVGLAGVSPSLDGPE